MDAQTDSPLPRQRLAMMKSQDPSPSASGYRTRRIYDANGKETLVPVCIACGTPQFPLRERGDQRGGVATMSDCLCDWPRHCNGSGVMDCQGCGGDTCV